MGGSTRLCGGRWGPRGGGRRAAGAAGSLRPLRHSRAVGVWRRLGGWVPGGRCCAWCLLLVRGRPRAPVRALLACRGGAAVAPATTLVGPRAPRLAVRWAGAGRSTGPSAAPARIGGGALARVPGSRRWGRARGGASWGAGGRVSPVGEAVAGGAGRGAACVCGCGGFAAGVVWGRTGGWPARRRCWGGEVGARGCRGVCRGRAPGRAARGPAWGGPAVFDAARGHMCVRGWVRGRVATPPWLGSAARLSWCGVLSAAPHGQNGRGSA